VAGYAAPRHAAAGLPDIQVHPVDLLDLERHMISKNIRDSTR
jgi:hypothetical protein